jgi:thioredoxin reductase
LGAEALKDCDLLVIGGGPAGMAAAISAKENGVSSLLLVERAESLGGILNQCLHSGFGLVYFGEELTGPQYAARFVEKVNKADVEVLSSASVISLKPEGRALISSEKYGLKEINTKAVILASGCRERPIGTLPIEGTRPSGIFAAGMAQNMVNLGGYNIGNSFVILGSGDVGLIMARQLKLLGMDVLAVIEKEDSCGALERNRINCLEKYDIPLRTRCTISKIHGKARITGVTVLDLARGHQEILNCDTLITSIGLIPERELSEEASIEGEVPEWLFLCGNSCYVHDSADDVTFEAERVGIAAAKYILNNERREKTEYNANSEEKNRGSALFCIGCPETCPLTKTASGFEGAVCGRNDPVLSKQI